MRKIAFFLILFLTLSATTAFAHPPSDIKITFDATTKMLTAVIMHNVKNTENHFIKKVDIRLNGKEIISHTISRQDNNESQTVSYLIPDVKTGDELSAEGYCSIGGKLKKVLTIE